MENKIKEKGSKRRIKEINNGEQKRKRKRGKQQRREKTVTLTDRVLLPKGSELWNHCTTGGGLAEN